MFSVLYILYWHIYQLAPLFLMLIFYGAYFYKMFKLSKKGIHTDQIAKSKTKDKVYYIELCMKIVTILIPFVEIYSILKTNSNLIQKVFGLYLTATGTFVFINALVAMKDSWRAGVAKHDERELITKGIYKYSRNPAFLGFDLFYLGILLMYFNIPLLIISLAGIVLFHLQILNEEAFCEEYFGKKYLKYKEKVSRYAGLGKPTYYKIILYIYTFLLFFSFMYFWTCMYYSSIRLSMVWLWIALCIFSFIRIKMLLKTIKGKLSLPKIPVIGYRICVVLFLIFFTCTELKIIGAMTAEPKPDLEYVIVLGAGVVGTTPTNPLRVRIEKAYEYMSENENTILIASGGQGPDEIMSEAQCIKDNLVARGISPDRIIMEDRSTSTEENLKFSLEIIGNPDASVGIITNGFHEFRAGMIAENIGYTNAHSVPAITLFPVGIHYTIREFFGSALYMVKMAL